MDEQKLRESAAGYTTSRMGYPNLEQVDESTGLLVRAAGEPLLSRQERRARVRAIQGNPHNGTFTAGCVPLSGVVSRS